MKRKKVRSPADSLKCIKGIEEVLNDAYSDVDLPQLLKQIPSYTAAVRAWLHRTDLVMLRLNKDNPNEEGAWQARAEQILGDLHVLESQKVHENSVDLPKLMARIEALMIVTDSTLTHSGF